MAEVAHVTYRVQLDSASAVAAATERLTLAGFAVAAPPDDASGLVLEASLTAEDDQADAALGQALTGIDHDPVIEWHRSRFTGFA